LIGRRKDTSLIGYGDGSKVRYKQLDKALKLDRKPVDVTIPYYYSKKEVWCLGAGEDVGKGGNSSPPYASLRGRGPLAGFDKFLGTEDMQ